MQSLATTVSRRLAPLALRQTGGAAICRHFSSEPLSIEDMPYHHHGERPRNRTNPKFKSPRKRASKLFDELNREAVEKSKEANPAMWKEEFAVGDSIEIQMVTQGGVDGPASGDNAQEIEKIRGVVLGIVNRGLSSSVILRDVVYGEPIERKIPMHSPMIKDVKISK